MAAAAAAAGNETVQSYASFPYKNGCLENASLPYW